MSARSKRKNKQLASSIDFMSTDPQVVSQVPQDRRNEILRYLRLFGYKPEKTILQIHIAGFFHKKRGNAGVVMEARKRLATSMRYGGTTFVVVGRTHDPSIKNLVIKPRRANQASPGYVGYLWKPKDIDNKSPDQLLPLDFTPASMHYPDEWKVRYATKGFMVAMHVPSPFAPKKNALMRAILRESKTTDPKSSWTFISSVENLGFESQQQDTIRPAMQDHSRAA